MAEPLLCKHQSSCYSRNQQNDQESDRYNDTSRGGQATRSSKTASSPESSTCFSFFVRPKFFVAGFVFGVLMESFYVQIIRLGLIVGENHTTGDDSDYTIKALKTWTNVFFYELSFICCDLIFLLYMLILTIQAIKRNLNINLPIMAANWTQGMVLGLSVTVVFIVGPRVVVQRQIWQILGSVVVGNALCFVAYETVLEMQKHCLMLISQRRPFPSSGSSSSSVDCSKQETPQQRQHDSVHDPNTIPLIAAHIV